MPEPTILGRPIRDLSPGMILLGILAECERAEMEKCPHCDQKIEPEKCESWEIQIPVGVCATCGGCRDCCNADSPQTPECIRVIPMGTG